MNNTAVIHGNFLYTPDKDNFVTLKNGYMYLRNGRIEYLGNKCPIENIPVLNYQDKLILPGFYDMHLHAPQFNQIGHGMDEQLLDWLNKYTFAEESKFVSASYAEEVYKIFADELVRNGTVGTAIFSTIHFESTNKLAEKILAKGLRAYVGKVNMDTNSATTLTEDTKISLQETEKFIQKWRQNKFVKPIITPRFVPSCTPELLQGLGNLAVKYNLPVQSHLSENISEVNLVKKLFPQEKYYLEVYDKFNLFGETPTLMAHCIHLSDAEISKIAKRNVYAVHCPDSNLNLSSGIMPVRKMLNAGVKIALGSDIGAGHSLFIPHAIVRAVQLSKLANLADNSCTPLKLSEIFYMATKSGGSFFGKSGSFEINFTADFIVVNVPESQKNKSLEEQLQNFIYHGKPQDIIKIYVAGKPVN